MPSAKPKFLFSDSATVGGASRWQLFTLLPSCSDCSTLSSSQGDFHIVLDIKDIIAELL